MDKLNNLKIAVVGCGYVGLPLIAELSVQIIFGKILF